MPQGNTNGPLEIKTFTATELQRKTQHFALNKMLG
jgi:hypothetical protein